MLWDMTIVAVVCVAGLLVWLIGPNKLKPPGMFAFGAGLLVWLFVVAQHTLRW